MARLLVLLVLFAAIAAAQQTFCQKYAALVFGSDTLQNEIGLINATVMYAFGELYTDPATREWFNGQSNPNRIDFGNNAAAAGNLVNHLIGYFGFALGCVASGFSQAYPVATANMTSVHAGFPKPINKAGYERFNQIIVDFLNKAGVAPADTYAVASVLDGFRNPPTSGPNNNQNADCNTAPFSVRVYDSYLNPPYISVPAGVTVAFEGYGSDAHTLRSSAGSTPSGCTPATTPLISASVPATGGSPAISTTFNGAGPLFYGDSIKCTQGMYGAINMVAPLPSTQTFCQKYAAAVFGTDNLQNEISLINATVMYAFGQLYGDAATKPWFNGQNNPGAIDFGANGAAATNLVKHLIGYFGFALGCTASGFNEAYPVAASNMTSVHANFPTPINKAAYERFNQIVLEFLAIAGVSAADRLAVASVLDGFRSKPLAGPNTNQICQAADCETSPYQVLVQDNFFNPSFISVPSGGQVQFVKKAGRTHTIVQAASVASACLPATSPLFNIATFSATAANTTTVGSSGSLNFPQGGMVGYSSTSNTDCAASGMFGVLNILPPLTTATITVAPANQAVYSPVNLSVNAPAQITWNWDPSNTKDHSVTAEDPSKQCKSGGDSPFDSGKKKSGSFTNTFIFGGVYNYYSSAGSDCKSGMRGTITVSGPPAPGGNSGGGGGNDTTNCYTNPNGVMTICWQVSGERITFTVTGKTTGWIATGVSDDALMPQSDIFWGQVDSQGPVIVDRYADARAQPPMDAQQDLTLDASKSGEANGVTTLVFSRLLKTQPTDNRDVDITNRDVFLMWAYSNNDATRVRTRDGTQLDMFSFQQHLTSGTAKVNLLAGGAARGVSRTDKLRKAHGIIMILAWMVCAVIGAFVARYFKGLMGDGWFQWLAVILNLIGFILIVVWINRQKKKHFNAPHQRLGLVIFILSVFQPIFGVLADKFFDPKRTGAPFFPDIVHWILGYGIIVLGLVNIWLGLSMYCVTRLAAIMYALVYAVVVGGFFGFEMTKFFASWGGFLGGHGPSRGEPRTLIGGIGAVFLVLLLVFSIIIMAEIGKEDSGNPEAYFNNCLIPLLTGREYWIRLTIYIVIAFALGVVAALVWIWRGSKSTSSMDNNVAYKELNPN